MQKNVFLNALAKWQEIKGTQAQTPGVTGAFRGAALKEAVGGFCQNLGCREHQLSHSVSTEALSHVR